MDRHLDRPLTVHQAKQRLKQHDEISPFEVVPGSPWFVLLPALLLGAVVGYFIGFRPTLLAPLLRALWRGR